MKKTIKMLGAVFLGAGIAAGAVAAEAWADETVSAQTQLTEADQSLVTTFRKYSACNNEKRAGLVNQNGELDPQEIPPDLLKICLKKSGPRSRT